MNPISDGLRKAVRDSGLTLSELSRASSISQGRLWEFMDGSGINSENADKLATYFSLVLSHSKKGDGNRGTT